MYTRRAHCMLAAVAGLLNAQEPASFVQVTGVGTQTVYEGVWLREVLKRAGVPQGGELRGKALAG